MAGSRRRGRATAANSTKNAVDADNNNDGVDGSSSKRRRTSGPAAAAALTEKDLSFQRVAARILDSQTKRGVLHYLVEYADPDPDHELTDQDREILATLPKEAWVRGDHACVSDEQIDEYVERSMIILAVVSVRPKSNISGLMLHSSPYAGLELADLEFLAELATPPTSKRKNLTPEKVGWRSWNMLTDEWKERLTKDHKDFLDKAKSSLERLNAIPLVLKETTRSTSNFGSHADGFNEDALGEAFRRKDLEGARRIVEALKPKTRTSDESKPLFRLAVKTADVEFLRVLRDYLPNISWKTVFQSVAASYIGAPLIDELLRFAMFSAPEIQVLKEWAVIALEKSNPATAVYLLSKLHRIQMAEAALESSANGSAGKTFPLLRRNSSFSSDEERNGFINLPKDGPFTLLHWQCLTARDVADVTEPVNAVTVNAGSLGLYLTPVHCAALNPNPAIIELLMRNDADMTLADMKERLPLHYAAMGGWSIYRHLADSMAVDLENTVSPTLAFLYNSNEVTEKEAINWIKVKLDRYGSVTSAVPPIVWALQAKAFTNCLWLRNWCLWNSEARLLTWYTPLFQQAVKMGSIAFFQQIHLFGSWSQEIFFKIADPERPSSASILASSFLNSANPIASLLCILAVAPRPYTVDVEVPKEVKKKTRDEPSFSENEMSDHESEEEEAGPQFETVLIDPSGFSSRSRELANDFASRSDGLSILRVLMDPRPSGVAEESIKSPYDFSANLFAQFRPEPIPEMQLDEVATASVLGLALQNGHLASVKYLVEAAKADIHASDENGCTMLMKCTRAGHLDCVKFLVERGVNINQGRDDEDEEMEEVEMKEEELPFHGRVFVCTGILKWASATLARLIQRCGGKLVQAVSGNVTHCICGKDGLTEWGQKTGIGSVKYKECKKRKIPFLPESAVDEALAKLPKYLSHADQLNAVVVGTVLHDFMQHAGLHEDETEDGVVRNKAVETILYLVDHGADLNFEDEDGELPLNVFVRCRNEGPSSCRVLKAVLDVMSAHTECKIDHKVSSQYQMTALQYCVVNHKHLFAKCLIEAWKYDINITSIIPLQRTGGKDSPFIAHAGENILHILTRRGAAELVEVVLKVAHDRNLQINVPKQGIEVNLFKADQKPELPDEGWSPLHLAARDLQGETQAVILKHFAEYPEIMFDFPTTDSKQLTVAHLLYMNWHTPHVHVQSVSINADPFTLVTEIKSKRKEVCKMMPDFSLWISNAEGILPFHFLCRTQTGAQQSLDMFIKEDRAALKKETNCGDTPLSFALRNLDVRLCLELLKLGANLNKSVTFTVRDQTTQISIFRFCLRFKLWPLIDYILNQPELDAFQALEDAISESLPQMALKIIAVRNIKFSTSSAQGESYTSSVQLRGRLVHILLRNNSPPSDSKAADPAFDMCKTLIQQEIEEKHSLMEIASVLSDMSCWTDFENLDIGQVCVFQAALLRGHGKIITLFVSHLAVHDVVKLLKIGNLKHGRTILHLLALRGASTMLHSVVDLLHSNNIKSLDHINDFDDYGKTALHYALSPNLEMGLRISPKAKLLPLLKLGASAVVTAKKWKTKSVTYLASTLPKQLADEVVELLVAHSPEMDEPIKKESEMGRQAREHAIHKARALAQEDAKGVVNLVSAKKRHQEKVRKIRKEKAENEFSDQCKNANLLYVPVDTGFLRQRDYDVYIEPIEGGEGGDIHDAFLTLVDMDYNVFGMNKFYVIQLLKQKVLQPKTRPKGRKERLKHRLSLKNAEKLAPFVVFTRWGRIGEPSYSWSKYQVNGSSSDEYTDLEDARKAFHQKFLEKTGNEWANRNNFQRYSDRYSWQIRYYRKKDDPMKANENVEHSALDGRTQSLLKTITDEKTLNKDLSNFNIDLQRLPAGQFSLKQIHESFQVLSDIAKVAGQKAYVAGFRGQRAKDAQSKKEFQKLQERLFDLNNRFYEIIPHDFGERRPTVIESKEAIREKFDMLQVMSDVTEAMGCVEEDLLKEARLSGKSKVDVVYEGLGAQIVPLEDGELQHKMVHDYILKTAERSVKVKNLFQVRRYEEVSSFAPFVGGGETVVEDNEGLRPSNVLLWHGSRVSNIAGILSRGLLIAPPEAPQTGLMFGKGVYFADTFEKSANYTGWSDVRYMLLCEVALGQSACLTYARYMEKPLHGSDSTKGVGQRSPDRSEWLVRTAASEGGFGDDVGVSLPAAPIKTQHVSGFATLGRNEYIVYDTSRIRIRYLVEFE